MNPRAPWLAAALFLGGCIFSTDRQARGGSTDTGNTIATVAAVTGALLDTAGGEAGRADLFLRRADYLAPIPSLGKWGAAGRASRDLIDTATDAAGRFRLDSLEAGDYRLEARRGNEFAGLYDFTAVPARRALDLPARRLAPFSRVSGTVTLRADALRGYVQVYGMARLMPINLATGRFELSLPAGAFTLRFVDPEGGPAAIKTRPVTLAAGDSLDLGPVDLRDSTAPYPEWSHARRLWLNTTASGAPMPHDVYDFPLLVRLDSTLIDFSQADPQGADLRFTKAGGKTPLPYEIERWDAAGKRAEVWVRMDTVRGESADQYLVMLWGNAAAKDSSSGPAVFPAAAGFGGVWHLGEGSNEAGFPGYRDASGNGNTGRPSNIPDTAAGPGLIGRGQRLDGTAYVRVADAASLDFGAGDFCISLWARPDVLSRTRQLLSKRENEAGDYEFQLTPEGYVENFTGEAGSSETLRSRAKLGVGQWHLLAMRRSGSKVGFYVDGVLDTAHATAAIFDLDNASDFFIGHDAQNLEEGWIGAVDEVRTARRAWSDDWLRLSYLSQVPGSRLVSPYRQ
jgi:hypothetical protein